MTGAANPASNAGDVDQLDYSHNFDIYLFVYQFRWNQWNLHHVAKHAIHPRQAEYVVNHPFRGYPERGTNKKYLVRGQDFAGFYLQVIYVFDPPGIVYVIHARPLNDQEKRRLRRRRRS